MLTSKTKQVLDVLIAAQRKTETDINLYPSDELFKGLLPLEVESALKILASDGYIELKTSVDGGKRINVTVTGLDYKELEERKIQPSQIFNIGNVSNSAFGNTGTINVNNSISQIRDAIKNSDSSDKDDLQKITDILEMIANDEIPAKKGLLSKFSDVLERNGWYTPKALSIVFGWLTTQ